MLLYISNDVKTKSGIFSLVHGVIGAHKSRNIK